MKLSFASTCMNREEQMRITLPINLNLVNKTKGAELIICNFSSKGKFKEVVDEVAKDFNLDTSKLKIIDVFNQPFFRHSLAKNIAHKRGIGDVLINLDIDNILCTEFIDFIIETFTKNINSVTDGNVPNNNGSYGRICISKDNFYKLGGYREDFDGSYGEEDPDLVKRAVKFLHCEHLTAPAKSLFVLDHSNEMRVENLENPIFNIEHKQKLSNMYIKRNISNPNGTNWGNY